MADVAPSFTNFTYDAGEIEHEGDVSVVLKHIERIGRRIARAEVHLSTLKSADAVELTTAYIEAAKDLLWRCIERRKILQENEAISLVSESESELSKPKPKSMLRMLALTSKEEPVDVVRGVCVAGLLLGATVLLDVRTTTGGFPVLRQVHRNDELSMQNASKYQVLQAEFVDTIGAGTTSVGNFRFALNGHLAQHNLQHLHAKVLKNRESLVRKGAVQVESFVGWIRTACGVIRNKKKKSVKADELPPFRSATEQWRVEVRQLGASAGKEVELSGDTFSVRSGTAAVDVAKDVLRTINATLSQLEWGVTDLAFLVFMNNTRVAQLRVNASMSSEAQNIDAGRRNKIWNDHREISRLVFKDPEFVLQQQTASFQSAKKKREDLTAMIENELPSNLVGASSWGNGRPLAIAGIDSEVMTILPLEDHADMTTEYITATLGAAVGGVVITSPALCDTFPGSRLSREVVASVCRSVCDDAAGASAGASASASAGASA